MSNVLFIENLQLSIHTLDTSLVCWPFVFADGAYEKVAVMSTLCTDLTGIGHASNHKAVVP